MPNFLETLLQESEGPPQMVFPGNDPRLQQVAQQPVQIEQPRPRRSFLETIGQISDVIARVGGAEAMYQPTLDAREDRTRMIDVEAMRKQQMEQQLQSGDMELANARRGRIGMAVRGLQAIQARGGDPAKAWPILAQQAGLEEEEAVGLSQIFASDPNAIEGVAAMFNEPRQQGSKPKEIAIYELLQAEDPESAGAYLKSLSSGGSMSPYQAEQVRLAEGRLAVQQANLELNRDRYENPPVKAGAGVGAKPPAKLVTGYVENRSALTKIDQAIAEVRKYPGAFGVTNAITPEIIKQRTDPKGVTARGAVANIGSLRIHERSGAANPAAEMQRLTPFIPSDSDTAATIIKKLEAMKKEIKGEQAAMVESFPNLEPSARTPRRQGETQRRTPRPSNGPKVGSVVRGWRFNGGDPSKQSNWSKVP